jgi:hypothetical protein
MFRGLWFTIYVSGFMVHGLLFRVYGSCFTFQGSWFIIYVSGFMVYVSEFMVCGVGLHARSEGMSIASVFRI